MSLAGVARMVLTTFSLVILLLQPAFARVELPAILGDNMVLQRGRPFRIWGRARPGEHVSVAYMDQRATTAADGGGKWSVKIGPLATGGPASLKVTGENAIVLRNVLVGEVWLCSGQSNMAMPVTRARDAQRELANARDPSLRLFRVRPNIAVKSRKDIEGRWRETRSESVRDFSATGYFFGRALRRRLGVPVGLIDCSMGSTPVEAWISPSAIRADPDYPQLMEFWKKAVDHYPQAKRDYEQQLTQWKKDHPHADPTEMPQPPLYPRRLPSGCYNGMLEPVIPFPIRGAIWYQGESNRGRPWQYERLMHTMIRDWRHRWGEGDFPFLQVQLANFGERENRSAPYLALSWKRRVLKLASPVFIIIGLLCLGLSFTPLSRRSGRRRALFAGVALLLIGALLWPLATRFRRLESIMDFAWIREAQRHVLDVRNTAMIVAIDIGEARNIHFTNKQELGRRLSLAALAMAYGKREVYSGPMYSSMKVEGRRLRLHFNSGGGNLAVKGGGPLHGFVIAGDDRLFYWADARIEKGDVVVWSDQVGSPRAVRYGWADNPDCNLINKAGLPASPFRTDDWQPLGGG